MEVKEAPAPFFTAIVFFAPLPAGAGLYKWGGEPPMIIDPQEPLFKEPPLTRAEIWRRLGLDHELDDRYTVCAFGGSRSGKLSAAQALEHAASRIFKGDARQAFRTAAEALSNRTYTVTVNGQTRVLSAFEYRAFELGRRMEQEGWRQVYGAGDGGVMGAPAQGALSVNPQAEVFGFTLHRFVRPAGEGKVSNEGVNPSIRGNVLTETLAERKFAMFAVSDAFVVLPGGYGTLDESMESITLEQIGVHRKPTFFFNMFGFFDRLNDYIHKGVLRNGFAGEQHAGLMRIHQDVDAMMLALHKAHVERRVANLSDFVRSTGEEPDAVEIRAALATYFGTDDAVALSRRITQFIAQYRKVTVLAGTVLNGDTPAVPKPDVPDRAASPTGKGPCHYAASRHA